MSRLIDADALMKYLNDNHYASILEMCMKPIIEKQPTVFDVEKVISGLEEEKDIAYADFDKYANDYFLDLDENVDDWYYKGLARAIDVIRKGGVK